MFPWCVCGSEYLPVHQNGVDTDYILKVFNLGIVTICFMYILSVFHSSALCKVISFVGYEVS